MTKHRIYSMSFASVYPHYVNKAEKTSSALIEQQRNIFVKQQEMRMAAVRRLDVPAANRHFDKASAAARVLAATPEGRAEIARLLEHPTLHIRLGAAENIMDWDPEKVIPLLGRLLYVDLSAIESPDERLDIRDRAKLQLYKHFEIRSWDRNDLIEPLKAYGVELPYRNHTKWQ